MISSKSIRKKILELCKNSQEGHIASSFSIVEILIAIHFVDRKHFNSKWFENIVLSKGHAVYALYGLVSFLEGGSEILNDGVGSVGSKLIGHVPQIFEIGLSCGTGSLGHGLPFALGRAFALEKSSKRRIHVIVGDGEMNEGTFWESINLLQKFPLLRINIYIDANGSSDRAIPMAKGLIALRQAYGAIDVNGHDLSALCFTINDKINESGSNIIICATQKGYPISEIINDPSWHHRVPSEIECNHFISQLDREI